MKNTIKLIMILPLLACLLLSCGDQDSISAGDRNIIDGSLSITEVEAAIFLLAEKETTYIKFTVDGPKDANLAGGKVQVSLNGQSQRVDIEEISSIPSTIQLTLVDVITALGMSMDNINGGETVNIEVLTKAGNGNYYRSNTAMNSSIACDYSPETASGSYVAESGSWGVNGGVTLTPDSDDPYTIYVSGLALLDGIEEDLGPLPFIINPTDYSVSAPKTALATEVWSGYQYLSYEGSGTFNTCTEVYEMTFEITVDAGSYGTHSFSFMRPE
nr:hypothetical protein [uncultured Carboxylicivirga sp.]